MPETVLSREQGSAMRILITRYLDRPGDGKPFSLVKMGWTETINLAVMAGLGTDFLSLYTVEVEIRSGAPVALNLPVERHRFLMQHRDQPAFPATHQLTATILGLKGSFLPGAA